MSARNVYRRWIVAVAMAGILNPCLEVRAESPASSTGSARVPDVRLDAQGCFGGMVVDGQGRTVAMARLRLVRSDQRDAAAPKGLTATTDAEGRFRFHGLSAGTYRIETSEGVCLCRLWTPKAAPPSSSPSLLVVHDARVERGQRPIREIFHSDPLLMATVVAAAIAIPIAVHKSRDEAPEGS